TPGPRPSCLGFPEGRAARHRPAEQPEKHRKKGDPEALDETRCLVTEHHAMATRIDVDAAEHEIHGVERPIFAVDGRSPAVGVELGNDDETLDPRLARKLDFRAPVAHD